MGYGISPAPPKSSSARLPLASGRYALSASQLSTFGLCKRKWAWRYIARVQEPPNAAADLGGRVHSVLEAWLTSGVAPDRTTREGAIALAGLKHLPPPGSGVVEHGFLLHTPRNTYIGYIDYQGVIDGLPTVLDHKTTSNLNYAKTEEELLFDIQALIYALFACIAWNTDEVGLKWVYYTTAKTPRSPAPVKAKLRLPQVIEKFQAIEAVADEIGHHLKNKTHPLALAPNANGCEAYGGCPHRERCNLTDEERMKSLMSEVTMEQKLGMVPVFDASQQPQLPQWNPPQSTMQLPQTVSPPVVQTPTYVSAPLLPVQQRGHDGKLYQQGPDGQWYPVQEAPAQLPAFAQPQSTFVAPQQQAPAPTTFGAPTPQQAQLPTFNPPAQQQVQPQINAPEGPGAEPVKSKGKSKGKKLEKLTSDRLAFLAGVHAAIMGGVRDSAQLQQAGEVCLNAFKSKFGE